MAARTTALSPTAFVTNIPGRYAPVRVVDKRSPSTITTSTTSTNQNALLYRTETVDSSLDTPTTAIVELGTNYNVGEYDDIAESKMTITSYNVGVNNLSLITGKVVNTTASSTTTFGFPDFSSAIVDIVRQFADPNGHIFASLYMGDMVIDSYKASLKSRSSAMEEYSLKGFNAMFFRGQIETKAYVVLTADVTNGYVTLSSVFGTNTGPIALPVPSGGQPASYWIQRGSLNFLKVERYRSSLGFVRIAETSGSVATGFCKYTTGSTQLAFATGDIVAGDVLFITYCTYVSDVTGYSAIQSTTPDTSDPVAVSTRLTPITISANALSRGTSFDMTLTMKRDRADGVGDTSGFWGVPDAPELAVSMEVDMTDFGLLSVLTTGSPAGTDTSGTVTGDFHDPNYATRTQLTSPMAVSAKVLDPRNASATLVTYSAANVFFSSEGLNTTSKSSATMKFSGKDQVGNLSISYTHP